MQLSYSACYYIHDLVLSTLVIWSFLSHRTSKYRLQSQSVWMLRHGNAPEDHPLTLGLVICLLVFCYGFWFTLCMSWAIWLREIETQRRLRWKKTISENHRFWQLFVISLRLVINYVAICLCFDLFSFIIPPHLCQSVWYCVVHVLLGHCGLFFILDLVEFWLYFCLLCIAPSVFNIVGCLSRLVIN